MIKTNVDCPEGIVDKTGDIRSFPFEIHGKPATLYVKASHVVRPSWAEFFEGHLGLEAIDLKSAHSAAVLVLSVRNRWFAVTFGYGRHLLVPGVWEPNFGLKVTLNSISDSSIRSIDRKSFDTVPRHTREQASRAGSIEQFGLRVEQDLLRAVVGNPEDETLGRRMAGMDALTVTAAVSLTDLPGLLERYAKKWQEKKYRDRYPWVDHITEIRDKRHCEDLDDLVVRRLITREYDHIWLAVPEAVDWSQVGGFRFSHAKSARIYDDIHVRDFTESLRNPSKLSAGMLRRKKVFCLDPDGRRERYQWSVYQCLYAEIRRNEDVFLLTGGRWYRVAQSFVQKIERELSRLQPTRYNLPPYDHHSESAYNQTVASGGKDIVLMDRKNIQYGGGASQIEFCDLFIEKRAMLHVKRYGGSSVLSHLFSQAVVSGTLFLQDVEFRKEVRKKLSHAHRAGVPEEAPRPDQYEIGFAIISRSKGNLNLPFFSKVNLRNAVGILTGFGYHVTLTKIPVKGESA